MTDFTELTTAVTRLAETTERLLAFALDQQERAEKDEREQHDEKWSADWFVFSDERGEQMYKSEEAAYEGGRYWREHSARPATVEVYCRSKKSVYYRDREIVPPSSWAKNQEAVPA